MDTEIERAAAAIREAEALLITAGAGMGVDSGLPDFRGDKGFWKAYPPFHGQKFAEISNPVWFARDPEQAWGFFGHRLNLYRQTTAHVGFSVLLEWAQACEAGHFVFTSNVDGHFQQAGFAEDRVVECHGSIHHLQCCRPCCDKLWTAVSLQVEVDAETIRATSPLPRCLRCDCLARPNIMMFDDYAWVSRRWREQQRRYAEWCRSVDGKRLTVIEFGAGVTIPTVRHLSEGHGGTLVRVNPRDHQAPAGAIALPLGALEAIERISAAL